MTKQADGGGAPAIDIDQIIPEEVKAIEKRRRALESKKSDSSQKRPALPDAPKSATGPALDVTALALSGGGIRSASFSLGVLQALNEHNCFSRIDYLSTVSGGGYIGSSLSATMTKSGGDFVFGKAPRGNSSGLAPDEIKDTLSLQHLRNYSNYLMPFGARDLITSLAIITRGLVANGTLVLGIMLVLASGTILGSPIRSLLYVPNVWGIRISALSQHTYFGITLALCLVVLPLFLGWAIYRSFNEKKPEFRTYAPTFFALILILIAAFAIFELQPFVIAGMFDLADRARESSDYSILTYAIHWLVKIATPIAAVVTFFRQQIGTLFKSVTTSSRGTTKLLAFLARIAIWIAGAALPLLLWVGYLYICYWGIANDGVPNAVQAARPAAIHGTFQIEAPGVDLRGSVSCRSGQEGCLSPSPAAAPAPPGCYAHSPKWLVKTVAIIRIFPEIETDKPCSFGKKEAEKAGSSAGQPKEADPAEKPTQKDEPPLRQRPLMLFYFMSGLLLWLIATFLMSPNANSLHQLYRDRLSKAFLFQPPKRNATNSDPDKEKKPRKDRSETENAVDESLAPLGPMRVSELSPDIPSAPYHLINATLNVQGSDFANRRGRNADFFLFSPFYVGSHATGYAKTRAVEEATNLDLATAMTISGAAFSPNAGAASIRALTATLALLNIRTGYWLKNPRFVAATHEKPKHRLDSFFYLFSEVTGRLYEDSKNVYLSDGGHIENLAIYELLRRRAKVIVVVDAEADPAMRFPSFVILQRYARIDLGVRINMPWDKIHETSIGWMGFDETVDAQLPPEKQRKRSTGPHTAIGTIEYDGGAKGWLLYVKASLTGDENDYVRDYARRYDQFPQESTGDQFFSEEQFEVYRALGFHIMNRLLNGTDTAQVYVDGPVPAELKIQADHPNVKEVREALLGLPPPAPKAAPAAAA